MTGKIDCPLFFRSFFSLARERSLPGDRQFASATGRKSATRQKGKLRRGGAEDGSCGLLRQLESPRPNESGVHSEKWTVPFFQKWKSLLLSMDKLHLFQATPPPPNTDTYFLFPFRSLEPEGIEIGVLQDQAQADRLSGDSPERFRTNLASVNPARFPLQLVPPDGDRFGQ